MWAYRNTIKALNWYTSVREKLDDPKYASCAQKQFFAPAQLPDAKPSFAKTGSRHRWEMLREVVALFSSRVHQVQRL